MLIIRREKYQQYLSLPSTQGTLTYMKIIFASHQCENHLVKAITGEAFLGFNVGFKVNFSDESALGGREGVRWP